MADKTPVKAYFAGSDVTALGEFESGDTIAVTAGGTGATTAAGARTNLSVPQVGPTFRATRSTNQTAITNSAFVKVQFATEDWDSASAYDNVTNYRFLPLVAGYYNCAWGVVLNSSANNLSVTTTQLAKNGVDYARGNLAIEASANTTNMGSNGSTDVALNGSTDYVEVFALGTVASGNLNVLGSTGSFFNCRFVRPL